MKVCLLVEGTTGLRVEKLDYKNQIDEECHEVENDIYPALKSKETYVNLEEYNERNQVDYQIHRPEELVSVPSFR
jgi:hypothetical protein